MNQQPPEWKLRIFFCLLLRSRWKISCESSEESYNISRLHPKVFQAGLPQPVELHPSTRCHSNRCNSFLHNPADKQTNKQTASKTTKSCFCMKTQAPISCCSKHIKVLERLMRRVSFPDYKQDINNHIKVRLNN